MPNLAPGQNIPIETAPCQVHIKSGATADFSAFMLYENGKTRADGDFIFYGQTANPDGAVRLSGNPAEAIFAINLSKLAQDVKKIVLAVTPESAAIAQLGSLELMLNQNGEKILGCAVELRERKEAALILGEIYRYGSGWKFRFIDQGYNSGLKPLAESFGVEISEDQTQPRPKVNLAKITLTKEKPAVDLTKHDLETGIYRVNLNWRKIPGRKGGRLGRLFNRSAGVDLDLAAYVRLANGEQTIVQALGNTFGSLDAPPYVKLLGDDRTGQAAQGEWLEINGSKLDEIREIIIYTFIYEGVPSWAETDATVRVEFSGLPEIETTLTEGNNAKPMCAIARIINEGGKLRIERLNRYYSGHAAMDRDFGWGFAWKRGSKD